MENKEIFAVMVVGQQSPSVAFNEYLEAENEAKRLVKKERKPAYVLKAVAFLEEQEVKVTMLDNENLKEFDGINELPKEFWGVDKKNLY